MTLPKCYDGGRHRWRVRGTYGQRQVLGDAWVRHGQTYDRWCSKCGKWYAPLLAEARAAAKETGSEASE